jgi:hypothetical protein
MYRQIIVFIQALLMVFILQIIVNGQNSSSLKLTNDREINIVNNVTQDISSITILEREFEAILISFGKANPLSSKILSKLKSKNKKIYNQSRKITTAFSLNQGENKFYLRGLNSIKLSNFRNGEFKVKCRIYLLKISSKGEISYIPIIISIRKI